MSERDLVDVMLDFENGVLGEEETIEFFQHLVDTGAAWSLQGSYGRMAQQLIEAGYVHEQEDDEEEVAA